MNQWRHGFESNIFCTFEILNLDTFAFLCMMAHESLDRKTANVKSDRSTVFVQKYEDNLPRVRRLAYHTCRKLHVAEIGDRQVD